MTRSSGVRSQRRVRTFSRTKTDGQPRDQRRILIFEPESHRDFSFGPPRNGLASSSFCHSRVILHCAPDVKSENGKTRRHQTRPYSARQDGSLRMQKCKVSSNQSSRACEILNLGSVVPPPLSFSFFVCPFSTTFALLCPKMPLEPYFLVSLWITRLVVLDFCQ